MKKIKKVKKDLKKVEQSKADLENEKTRLTAEVDDFKKKTRRT